MGHATWTRALWQDNANDKEDNDNNDDVNVNVGVDVNGDDDDCWYCGMASAQMSG